MAAVLSHLVEAHGEPLVQLVGLPRVEGIVAEVANDPSAEALRGKPHRGARDPGAGRGVAQIAAYTSRVGLSMGDQNVRISEGK